MTNTAPITFESLFRFWRDLPHQRAAIAELEQDLRQNGYTAAMRRDRPWFHSWSQADVQQDPPRPAPVAAWLAPALRIVKEFEGCHLQAYLCPAGVPTIGWGSTSINGKAVQMGQAITRAQADAQLNADLQRFYNAIAQSIPAVAGWPPNRVAALVSWVYNVGIGAMQDSALRRRILAGEDPAVVIAAELPRWNKAGDKELPGLTRRRAAEVALFVGRPAVELQQQGGHGNPLQVPWYSQMDSADREQAARMCFSSSCAMLLQYLKPGTLTGPNGDDQYLKRVRAYGDTTDPTAQIRALSNYGIRAQFTKVAGWRTIEDQIAKGVPVPCGFLHRGPVSAPSGGGHWLIVVGHDRDNLIVHDPFGQADLVSGRTIGGVARFMRYSRRNFGPRWMVEGTNTGWAVIAER
jgi:GH24 family phage-related lysozyme (muramidase)